MDIFPNASQSLDLDYALLYVGLQVSLALSNKVQINLCTHGMVF